MELSMDLILEVALQADFDTTLSMLDAYSVLDTENFWRIKCTKLYPHKTYLEAFCGPENFVLKSKKFAILVHDEGDFRISDCLIDHENYDRLSCYLMIINNSFNELIRYIVIDVTKIFIVIKRNSQYKLFIFFQADQLEDCNSEIEKDSIQGTYDSDYYVINMNEFTFSTIECKCVRYKYYYASYHNRSLR